MKIAATYKNKANTIQYAVVKMEGGYVVTRWTHETDEIEQLTPIYAAEMEGDNTAQKYRAAKEIAKSTARHALSLETGE